jgi:WD40 repeat protein
VISHRDGRLSLHELPSGQVLRELALGRHCPRSAFHPQGRWLAVAHGTTVQIWDLASGQRALEFGFPLPEALVHLAWSPDGTTLASASHDNLALFSIDGDQKRSRLLHQLQHAGGGLVMGFDPSGEVLCSASNWVGGFRLWHARTGKLLLSHGGYLSPEFFKASGYLVTDWTTDEWEVATGREYRTLTGYLYGGSGYWHPTVDPGGRLLVVGRTTGVGFWDLESGTELAYLPLGHVRKPLFQESGPLVIHTDAGVFRWSVRTGSDGTIHVGPYVDLGFPRSSPEHWIDSSRDGGVIAQSNYNGAFVLRRGQPLLTLGPHKDSRRIAVSPDGRWVVTVSHSQGDILIWDLQAGTPAMVLPEKAGDLPQISRDGRWFACDGRYWAVGSWDRARHLVGGSAVAFAPGGDLLAAGGRGVLHLFAPQTGRELARVEEPEQDPGSLATFSPDGTKLITATSETNSIHIWDLRLIRRRLAAMGLDWDQPPYPAPESAGATLPAPPPLRLLLEPREASSDATQR